MKYSQFGFDPFGSVPVPKKGRTVFNESHSLSGTFPLSTCVPVFFTDTIPGDSWTINVHNLTKLETLIAPAMQRVDASLLWFKLPKRLVFKHFKKWYSGGTDGRDEHQKPFFYLFALRDYFAQYIVTQAVDAKRSAVMQEMTEFFFGPGSLWNYLGLPVPLEYNSSTGAWTVLSMEYWDQESEKVENSDVDFVDAMPLMAYHMIYDQYIRDQTLCPAFYEDSEEGILKIARPSVFKMTFAGVEITFDPASGNDLSEGGELTYRDVIYLLLTFNRSWRKEYFTSALPTPQRGPEVSLTPFSGTTVPVSIDEQDAVLENPTIHNADTISFEGNLAAESAGSHAARMIVGDGQDEVERIDGSLSVNGTADLSGLSPITIVAFRNLFKLQAFLEKNNVAGGRYIETILAHWAERVPDFTVQRVQHVRSTSIPVQINEVTATANTSGVNSLVGDQAGRARVQGNLGKVRIYTQEPSFIFALYNVTAPPMYAGQGIPKLFQRKTRFDEPWRDFQHIGEQAVKTRELYFPFVNSADNDTDFGYQQRFSEYKYMPDRVVGDFVTSLSYWHMARMFADVPALNKDFVEQHLDPRIFAVQNARPVFADFFFEAKAKRKLSKFSTPKLT